MTCEDRRVFMENVCKHLRAPYEFVAGSKGPFMLHEERSREFTHHVINQARRRGADV